MQLDVYGEEIARIDSGLPRLILRNETDLILLAQHVVKKQSYRRDRRPPKFR